MPVLRLEIAGLVFSDWTRAQITRGLSTISGSFELEYDDRARTQQVLPQAEAALNLTMIAPPVEARLLLDDELVLLGWIEDVDYTVEGAQVRARIAGRDRTGWLVECSANPNGPSEYKGLTVLDIATRLCAPFGVAVRAEVDVGAPLRDFGLELGESVMSAIDKAAKQRALLVTSDGVGGLVLTRSGIRRAPAPLTIPGNVVSAGAQLSTRERFSDYWVKGQTRPDRGGRAAALGGAAAPATTRGATSASAAATQQGAIISTGHASDPAITQYRPKVFSVRSQSGGAPNQVLAQWRMRIARGRSTRNRWTVAGWRDGPDARLWRPNELVNIQAGSGDPFDGLVASVKYSQDVRQGSRTELEVVGREAYDLAPLPDGHRRHAAVAPGSNVTKTGGTSSR